MEKIVGTHGGGNQDQNKKRNEHYSGDFNKRKNTELLAMSCNYCKRNGHTEDKCKTKSVICNKCNKQGHYANACTSIVPGIGPNAIVHQGNENNSRLIEKVKVDMITGVEAEESTNLFTDTVVTKKMSNNLEQARKEYGEFEEKVKRSVLLSNLSPEVTAPILKMALEQFGKVVNIEFVQNFSIPYDIPQCALVEMEDAGKARQVVKTMRDFPFMISGMPRPVTAFPSKAEMFTDRPALPGRKINFRWIERSHPDFEVAERLKKLCSKHGKETLTLAKLQLEEEEKLGKQQEDMVLSNYKKHEMIELLMQEGTATKLAHRYGIDLSEESHL